MSNISLNIEDCLSTFIPPAEPKDYQISPISEMVEGLNDGKDIALSLPTGTGKTYVYLPIVSGAVNIGKRVCILVGTNYLINQLTDRYIPKFSTVVEPRIIKGIEHYECPLTGEPAEYVFCNEEQREECLDNKIECDVLNNIREMESHQYIITNFHKFLSTSTLRGFDLIIIDDSHGFENALEDHFHTIVPYYQLNMLFEKYEKRNELISNFVGEFLDYFDTAFISLPDNTIQRRLSNDVVTNIANIEHLEELENEIKTLPHIDRNVLYDLIYFIKCCKNATINTFYIQKDYYKQDDPTESVLIARKSETYQRRRLESLFKNSRVVFASATMGDVATHVERCTNRKTENGKVIIVPSSRQQKIENWFNGLNIFQVNDVDNDITLKSQYISSILSNIKGKSLLLFKSYRDQREAEKVLIRLDREITFIDESYKNEEVQELVESADIIMASASSRIWEGIDISNLKFEIIFSLPFIRPPVYLEPSKSFPFVRRKMLIRLQQGIGRLIRSETDQGICVVLDPRLETHKNSVNFSESYRKRIKKVSITKLIDEVERVS